MSDTIKAKIRKSLAYNLGTVTKANGYFNNIVEINSEPRSEEQIKNYPAVNIFWGTEKTMEARHSSGWLHKETVAILDFHLENNNDIDTSRNKIVADVEKLLFNNHSLKDSTGNSTCNQVFFVKNDPWGMESNKIYGGITIELKILYQQNLFDPYSSAQGTPPAMNEAETSAYSLRETLSASILWNLTQITKANGYNRNIYADRDIQSYEQIKNYPFANVIARSEQYITQGTDRWVRKKIGYIVDIFSLNENQMNEETEALVADMEKKFFGNFFLIDANGSRTCTECYILSSVPFYTEATRPKNGVQFVIDVFYRQDLENPNKPST